MLTKAKFDAVLATIDRARHIGPGAMRGGVLAAPYFLFLTFTIFFAIIASVAATFGEPLATGSGIPELKVYLNGK